MTKAKLQIKEQYSECSELEKILMQLLLESILGNDDASDIVMSQTRGTNYAM